VARPLLPQRVDLAWGLAGPRRWPGRPGLPPSRRANGGHREDEGEAIVAAPQRTCGGKTYVESNGGWLGLTSTKKLVGR
jgi:hypothetical protein